MIVTRDSMARDLERLGLRRGDHVLVRAALRALGPTEGAKGETLVSAILDVIGEEGLLLGLSFSPSQMILRRTRTRFYDPSQPPITGGFACAMVNHPASFRSRHPTNSFVAIGPVPDGILSHGPDRPCFYPMTHLIESRGKMLLIGCTVDSPGFSTVHWAQHELGLSTRTWFSGLSGQYYRDGDRLRWYTKRDFPGCSRGFGAFYPLYRDASVLVESHVGHALTYLSEAGETYRIERDVLRNEPEFPLCDLDGCLSCRLAVRYKKHEVARFIRGAWQGQERLSGSW